MNSLVRHRKKGQTFEHMCMTCVATVVYKSWIWDVSFQLTFLCSSARSPLPAAARCH